MSRPRTEQRFVCGTVATLAGPIPQVSCVLSGSDRFGSYTVRWGIGRANFKVDPGLYALGNPTANDPVLVTANYKMSFDRLRSALTDRNAWILVLDTDGVNVWCAAGKGSFGTAELVSRIKASGLDLIVNHRRLILPQLSAPGVAAHQVKSLCGFRVIYGPIRSVDIPAFLDAGMKATAAMRIKTFPLHERIVLIPIELVGACKWSIIAIPILFLSGGIGGHGAFWANAITDGLSAILVFFTAILAGTVAAPILLPWLPGRAFSLKGAVLGVATTLAIALSGVFKLDSLAGRTALAGWLLLICSITAYLTMNFTGSSTYTSLSGVKREMRWALPLEIVAAFTGLALWTLSRLIA